MTAHTVMSFYSKTLCHELMPTCPSFPLRLICLLLLSPEYFIHNSEAIQDGLLYCAATKIVCIEVQRNSTTPSLIGVSKMGILSAFLP